MKEKITLFSLKCRKILNLSFTFYVLVYVLLCVHLWSHFRWNSHNYFNTCIMIWIISCLSVFVSTIFSPRIFLQKNRIKLPFQEKQLKSIRKIRLNLIPFQNITSLHNKIILQYEKQYYAWKNISYEWNCKHLSIYDMNNEVA